MYEMGTTQPVLEAEVVAGKQHHSQSGLPGLERLLDRLAKCAMPEIVLLQRETHSYSSKGNEMSSPRP